MDEEGGWEVSILHSALVTGPSVPAGRNHSCGSSFLYKSAPLPPPLATTSMSGRQLKGLGCPQKWPFLRPDPLPKCQWSVDEEVFVLVCVGIPSLMVDCTSDDLGKGRSLDAGAVPYGLDMKAISHAPRPRESCSTNKGMGKKYQKNFQSK